MGFGRPRVRTTDPVWIAGAGLLAALILAADLSLPLGVAGGVPYVALVCLGWYGCGPRGIIALGVVSSVLTVVGYFFSPDGGIGWVVLTNRFLALFAIWVTVAFLLVATRATEKVGVSRKRLSGLLALAPQAIVSVDGEQRIRLFNKGAEAVFGYAAEEVLGQPLHILLPSRYREEHRRHLIRFGLASSDSRAMGKHRKIVGLRKDGSEFPAKGAISSLELAGETVFTVMLYDCTEEEEAQRRIVELARFADEDPSPVLRVDPDGSVRYANKAAREVAEIFSGTGQRALTRALAADAARALDAGQPREVDFVAGERILALTLTPVPGGPYVNLYGRDVTARKAAEAALQEANDTLEQRVRERTAEYEAANLALEAEVAEHKLTEERRRDSETRLSDAIDSISEGFILYDSDERLVLCNATYRDLYPRIADLLVPGARLEDLIRSDAERGQQAEPRADIERWVQDRLEDYRRAEGTIEQQVADGRWVLASERRTREGGVVGIRTDITELKRAEAALRASEAQFRDLIAGSIQGVLIHGGSELLFANQAFADILGYDSPEEVLALPSIQVVEAPHEHERLADYTAARLGGGDAPARYEFEAVHKDGSPVWLENFATRVVWDGEPAIQSTLVNITERKRAEQALRASEAQFRDLIAGSIQGVLIHRDGEALFANQALADIFGYESADEILELPSVDVLKADGERDRLKAYSMARLRYGAAPERYEFEGVRKDGSAIWLENFVTVVGWHGAPAVQTTTVNITERKRAEEALACSSRDLKVARDQAEAANRAKSEFLATMSHELRTPLNAIIGFSEIIKEETFGPVGSPQYRGYATDIHGSGQHLLSLINDILDLSKVESGAEELHEEDVSVPDVANAALRLVRQRAEKAGVGLELCLGDDLPLLRADARKVKQILVNLLTNAVKFTDAGATVSLKAWCRPNSGFVFQVIDTGVGIAPEDIPKALSQFGQVGSQRNRAQEGTGLGLPLSKSLAELHGGSLDLQSRVGLGTTVTVRFPATRIVAAGDAHDGGRRAAL